MKKERQGTGVSPQRRFIMSHECGKHLLSLLYCHFKAKPDTNRAVYKNMILQLEATLLVHFFLYFCWLRLFYIHSTYFLLGKSINSQATHEHWCNGDKPQERFSFIISFFVVVTFVRFWLNEFD